MLDHLKTMQAHITALNSDSKNAAAIGWAVTEIERLRRTPISEMFETALREIASQAHANGGEWASDKAFAMLDFAEGKFTGSLEQNEK